MSQGYDAEGLKRLLNDQRTAIQADVEKYEAEIAGLPKFDDRKAPEYLTMDIGTLRRKSPEELSEAYFSLIQYSMYLQRVINKERAWYRYGESIRQEYVAKILPEIQNDVGWGGKKTIAENSGICQIINEWMRKIGMKIDRLESIPANVEKLAMCVRDLKFEKNKANQ